MRNSCKNDYENNLDSSSYEFITNKFCNDEESTTYVKMAVRYGYSYRKLAKEFSNSSNSFHYCIPEANELLLELGSLILSGIIWDGLKLVAKRIYYKNHKYINSCNDKETITVFTDKKELYKFYHCIKDFQDGLNNISEAEYKYIEEEMMADLCKIAYQNFHSRTKACYNRRTHTNYGNCQIENQIYNKKKRH